mgnify:CR=1 FL=1
MRTTSKLLAALLMAVGLGSAMIPAYAHGGMGMGGECYQSERGGRHQDRHAQRMEERHKQLHDALKLSASQEAAWKTFTESRPGPMMGNKGERPNWQAMTAPERADKMLEFSKQRQDRMAQHTAALKTFYATLTPEQQKTFDGFHNGPRGGKRGGPPAAAPAPAPAAK